MKKSVFLPVCLLAILTATTISVVMRFQKDKVQPPIKEKVSPARTRPKAIPSSHVASQQRTPIPGIAMYDRIEDPPEWTIRYGQEFWRKPTPTSAAVQDAAASGQSGPSNLNLGDIIDRVSHAIQWDERLQLPKLKALQYTAIFEDEGLTMVPHQFVREEVLDDATEHHGSASKKRRTVPIYEPDPSAAARFETVTIACGDQVLYKSSREELPSSFLGNTAQRLLNPASGLVEHYQADAEGIEVTWVLNSRPSSSGPLEIQAQFVGLSHSGIDSEGHLFADTTGTPRLSVSHATLVDSKGTRMQLPVAFVDDQLSVVVPQPALGQLTFPIAIDPTISPAMGGGIQMAANQQSSPAVAWNSSGSGAYLVVWQDTRNGNQEIYGTRVLASGRILNTAGFRIGGDPLQGRSQSPRVASNGTDWLVVWNQLTITEPPVHDDIRAVRVAADGSLGAIFPVCIAANVQQLPEVGVNGTDYFVVWLDRRSGAAFEEGQGEVFGACITGTSAAPPNGAAISETVWGTVPREELRIAGNGTSFMVIWSGVKPGTLVDGVYGTLIPTGSCTGPWNFPSGLLSPDGITSGEPAIAGQNNAWFVCWKESDAKVYGAPVDAGGIPGTKIQVAQEGSLTAIAGNGTDYLASWVTGNNDIRGARISSGMVLDPLGLDIASLGGNQIHVAVASRGEDYLVVWDVAPTFVPNDIWGSRVSANAPTRNVLDNFPISTDIPQTQMLDVALPRESSGSQTLLVWEDSRNVNFDIYGARIGLGGHFIDVNGLPIATGSVHARNPDVSATTDGWLIVWDESLSDVRGQKIYTDGTPSASIDICVVAGAQKNPTVAGPGAHSGTRLVVWEDYGGDLHGALVSPSLGVTQLGAVGGSTGNLKVRPSLANALSGSTAPYLLVWEESYGDQNESDIWARLFNDAGGALGSAFPISTDASFQGFPAAAGNASAGIDGGFAVVWQDSQTGGTDIYGVPILSDGSKGPNVQIGDAPVYESTPAISFCNLSSSPGYLVAWVYDPSAPLRDIRGARISVSNNTLSPDSVFTINGTAELQESPALGPIGSDGQNIAAYHIVLGSGHWRVGVNSIAFQ